MKTGTVGRPGDWEEEPKKRGRPFATFFIYLTMSREKYIRNVRRFFRIAIRDPAGYRIVEGVSWRPDRSAEVQPAGLAISTTANGSDQMRNGARASGVRSGRPGRTTTRISRFTAIRWHSQLSDLGKRGGRHNLTRNPGRLRGREIPLQGTSSRAIDYVH